MSHQLVPFVVVEQQRLFERSSNVSVCGGTLEVGCSILGEFVLRQILLFVVFRKRKSLIQVLLLQLPMCALQVLQRRPNQEVVYILC